MSKTIYFTRYGSEINISIEKTYKGNRAYSKTISNLDYRLCFNCKGWKSTDSIDIYLNKKDIENIISGLRSALFYKQKSKCKITNNIIENDKKFFKIINYPYILINIFNKISLVSLIRFLPKEGNIVLKTRFLYRVLFIKRCPSRIQPYDMTLSKSDTLECIKQLEILIN